MLLLFWYLVFQQRMKISRLFLIDLHLLIHCRAHRTPLCKSKRGNFKDTYPDDLLAPVLRVCRYLFYSVVGFYFLSTSIYR